LRKKLGVTDTKAINQIANMALVEWSDNIKISDQAPRDYWPAQVQAKKATSGLTGERLARQIHWHALPEGWQTLSYQDFLAQRRRRMAAVVKEAFGLLADHSYDPAYPAPTAVGEQAAPSGWSGYGVSVKDLLTAGLLTPGTLLLPARDDLDAIAEVLPDGRIQLDEEVYDTPSGAGRAALGMATNGWTFWIADTADGPRKLAELRANLVGDRA
jgi:hypothetical protein